MRCSKCNGEVIWNIGLLNTVCLSCGERNCQIIPQEQYEEQYKYCIECEKELEHDEIEYGICDKCFERKK